MTLVDGWLDFDCYESTVFLDKLEQAFKCNDTNFFESNKKEITQYFLSGGERHNGACLFDFLSHVNTDANSNL